MRGRGKMPTQSKGQVLRTESFNPRDHAERWPPPGAGAVCARRPHPQGAKLAAQGPCAGAP
jgi:hypothetical protein